MVKNWTKDEKRSYCMPVFAFVADTGNNRIGKSVNNVTDCFDQADNRQYAEDNIALCNEHGQTRVFGRLVKIDQVVVEHRCE